MSTVEIFVMPAFLAAVLMLASALKNKTPKKPVALAVPTFEPTGLLVALTGNVSEQLDKVATAAKMATALRIFLNIKNE